MTYEEAINFWFGRINFEIRSAAPKDLKLERMRALLAELGHPQKLFRIVHVAGTKGKGSTSAMLAEVLQVAGYRVGLFTSPHLQDVSERIQVNRVPISHEELTVGMAEIAPVVKRFDQGPWSPLTFFELSTALGFLHFARRRVDLAVVEVGLGGRFDSTNVCEPVVSVITSIGFDHMAQLGNTLEEIAFQKAGILKPNVPSVSGVSQHGPRAVVERVAQECCSRLYQVGVDYFQEYVGQSLRYRFRDEPPQEYELGLFGAHQAANAATVLSTVRQLRESGLSISETAVRKGLREVRWPARIELLRREPTVILDSAHNVPAVEALLDTLRSCFPCRGVKRVVFAVSSDKQYESMLKLLAGYFEEIHLTQFGNNPRCVPPEKLGDLLRRVSPNTTCEVHAVAAEAWQKAMRETQTADLLCVTGSVFLAGELQELVRGWR